MRHLIILFILFVTVNMYSQNTNSINGQLLDAEFNNNPLAFATISIKGSLEETTANHDGTYAFSDLAPGEYVLVYSFVGYETQERAVLVTSDNTAVVNVQLGALKPPFKLASSENAKENTDSEATLLQTKA